MIIQIRGTSGSGKSTVMRAVMKAWGTWNGVFVPGRKRPLYYKSEFGLLAVLGHYESACGGCDTIGSAAEVYRLTTDLQKPHPLYKSILQEGLLLSEDTKWSSQLPGLRCLFLTTPLERCLRQIKGRREEAGNDKPLDPTRTQRRAADIERARGKLEGSGVLCVSCAPEQAPGIILKWLRLHAQREVISGPGTVLDQRPDGR